MLDGIVPERPVTERFRYLHTFQWQRNIELGSERLALGSIGLDTSTVTPRSLGHLRDVCGRAVAAHHSDPRVHTRIRCRRGPAIGVVPEPVGAIRGRVQINESSLLCRSERSVHTRARGRSKRVQAAVVEAVEVLGDEHAAVERQWRARELVVARLKVSAGHDIRS
jgi:hypothetical protein